MGRQPVAMKEVAEAAGVSVTTVSDALNGKGRLPQTTRDHVRTIANRLGYQPSIVARSLASGKTRNLALTVSTADASTFAFGAVDYFVQLMSSATIKALEHGYSLILSHSDADRDASPLPLDGAIVVDPVLDDPALAEFRRQKIPVVTAGRDPASENASFSVDNDHAAGTERMLDHLARAGAQRIALVSGPPVHSYIVDALQAYEGWCVRRKVAPTVSFAGYSLTEAAGYAAASDLLSGPDRPDAIYATLDRLALGVSMAAKTQGLAVPDDLLIAGLSDSRAGRQASPSLTALALDPSEIGKRAVEMLAALVENRPVAEPHVTVATKVIPRASTRRRLGSRGKRLH
ncbi:MAG: LacI family DNA-binding transcriptional regulator [Gaiellaceae bacterium]